MRPSVESKLRLVEEQLQESKMRLAEAQLQEPKLRLVEEQLQESKMRLAEAQLQEPKLGLRLHSIENQLRWSENQLSLTSLRSISALPSAPLGQEVTTIDLGEGEPEYDYIVSMFQNSMVEHRKSFDSAEWCEKPKVEVTLIESVVNPVKQPLYELAKEEVKRGNPGGCEPVPGISAAKCQGLTGSDLNEYFLFHGSSYQQVGEILREGLDPQRGGESAGSMFGKGTYFAENASKADMYTTCDLCTGTSRECRHPTGQRCMMLAQVLLGSSYPVQQADSHRTRAREREGGGVYDSHTALKKDLGGCVDHMEYVIFRDRMALVRFLIYYRHAASCNCKDCFHRRS